MDHKQFDPAHLPDTTRLLLKLEVVKDMRRDGEPVTPSCSTVYIQALERLLRNRPRKPVWDAVDYLGCDADKPGRVWA